MRAGCPGNGHSACADLRGDPLYGPAFRGGQDHLCPLDVLALAVPVSDDRRQSSADRRAKNDTYWRDDSPRFAQIGPFVNRQNASEHQRYKMQQSHIEPTDADAPETSRAELGLRIVERCASDASLESIISDFLTLIRLFGFDVAAAGAWVGVGRGRVHRFYFNSWPDDWLAIYRERNLFHDDPVVAEARRRQAPFMWGELNLTKQGAEVYATARAYGWTAGFAVPVHGPAGYQGLVSLAALRREVTLDARARGLLRLAALAVHDRCRVTGDTHEEMLPAPGLTARELVCMERVALGQSDKKIAVVLGISVPTVHFHVEQAKRKLSARTRAEAVALLVLRGLI